MSYQYEPASYAICHVCGHRVRLTEAGIMYRHRYDGAVQSDWCVGGRSYPGELIRGFVGPYAIPPNQAAYDGVYTDADGRQMIYSIKEDQLGGIVHSTTVHLDGEEIVKAVMSPRAPRNHIEMVDHHMRIALRERRRAEEIAIDIVKTPIKQEQTMKTFDEMTQVEKTTAAVDFRLRHGYVPTEESLQDFVNRKAQEDREYVQVAFASDFATGGKLYTSRVAPGPTVNVGQYLLVHSPLTNRNELVRVCRLGREGSSYQGPCKTAQRVVVTNLFSGEAVGGVGVA